MKNLIGTESPDDLATEVLGVLTEGSNVPEAGNCREHPCPLARQARMIWPPLCQLAPTPPTLLSHAEQGWGLRTPCTGAV